MKRLIIALAGCAICAGTFAEVKIPTDKSKFKLVVLAGQSNMAGRGTIDPENNKPHPRVVMLNAKGEWVPCVDPIHYDIGKSGVGPGKAFAEALADSDPSIVVGVVPTAVGGTSIQSWARGAVSPKGGGKWKPYDDMVARTKKAQEQGTLAAILWHQGESDRMRRNGYLYQCRFPDMIDRYRKEVGAEGVPLIVGGLRNGMNDWFGKIISNAQRWTCEYAFGPGKWVPCEDDCALQSDKIHYTREVQQAFGKRYFEAYQEVLKNLAADKDYWKNPESEAAKIKSVAIPAWKDNKAQDGDRQMGLVPATLPDIVEKWLFPKGRPQK